MMTDEHFLSLQPGTVIAGRYEVVKCLGTGSMGLVYACRHREQAGNLVAVKVLYPEVAQDKIAAARFRNEIFASYGVDHPNVVRAYEYLRDGDLIAYTMEYVGGGDLADRLAKWRENPLPVQESIRLLWQMASGVQAIHDSGIIHRDLKPENILLTTDGQVKIADFGIARTGFGPKLTEHGGVVGTIDYVSPEYMLNSQVDWRSDIYALGILTYEMLTGDSPFRADSVYATMTKRLKMDAAPPSTHNSECPPELDNIVLKALSREPEARYQAATELQSDLLPLMERYGIKVDTPIARKRRKTEEKLGFSVPPPVVETEGEVLKETVVLYSDSYEEEHGTVKIESVLTPKKEVVTPTDVKIRSKMTQERMTELQSQVSKKLKIAMTKDLFWIIVAGLMGLSLSVLVITLVKPHLFQP